MKKRISIILLFATILFILICGGCEDRESNHKEKRTAKVIKELSEKEVKDSISYDLLKINVGEELLTPIEIEIVKRQTNLDDKTDNVWCEISYANNIYEYKQYVKFVFVFYDKGGWQIDDWELYLASEYDVKENPFSIDCALEYIKEDLEQKGQIYNNLECIEENWNSEKYVAQYMFKYDSSYKYCDTITTGSCEYTFDGRNWNTTISYNEAEETWYIPLGEYQIIDESKESAHYEIAIYDEYDVEMGTIASSFYSKSKLTDREEFNINNFPVEMLNHQFDIKIFPGVVDIIFSYNHAYLKGYIEAKEIELISTETTAHNMYAWYKPTEKVPNSDKGYTNIAIFGVDNSRGKGILKGAKTNINMILSIDNSTGEMRIINVLWNAYMDTGERYTQMRWAYMSGGAESAIKTINANLDMKIRKFITISPEILIELVDGVGGIWVEVDEEIMDSMNNYRLGFTDYMVENWKPIQRTGYQCLDGVQTVAYCLLRPQKYNSENWYKRQENVFMAIVQRIQAMDETELNELKYAISDEIYTSLDEAELAELKNLLQKATLTGVEEFPQKELRIKLDMDAKGTNMCPIDLAENVRGLHYFLFGQKNYQVSDTIMEIAAHIENDMREYAQD